MDVEDVAPGQVFTDTINRTIAGCEVVLVVIGPKWMEILEKRAQVQQPDYVRHEVEAALSNRVTVIPVLVGGATMAQLSNLPPAIASLKLYNAAELRDSTFKDDCTRLAKSLKVRAAPQSGRSKRQVWIGAATAVALIIVGVFGFLATRKPDESRGANYAIEAQLATARSQANRGEYESAFRSYQKVLAEHPADSATLDLQADAAMGWIRNFHVLVPEGKKAEDLAGPALAELISVFDAALARTDAKGSRAADVLAHLGWAHWLNQRMAHKEFGPAAERDLRESLRLDASNVFANAMLGNWIIQNNRSTDEALRCLEAAVKTGKERAFVRRMQLGAMTYNDDPRISQELIRAVNDMRKNGEPIEDVYKRRTLSAYSPMNSMDELKQTLSALPPDEALATFQWLDGPLTQASEADQRRLRRDFINAIILEVAGKNQEALAAFSTLGRELKKRGYDGRFVNHVSDAVKRLSR
jgi:tetratricopeptide (TPR) repeat protein